MSTGVDVYKLFPARVPFVDPNTGILTAGAVKALTQLVRLLGGEDGTLPVQVVVIPSGGTPNGMVYLTSLGALTSTGAPTSGQILIGRTGTTPILGSITGTTNRVIVSNGFGTITLSTPQNIHSGATPQFLSVALSSLTENGFLYPGPAKILASTPAATNGQLLIGSTGAAPAAANLTGTANQVAVTNGPGAITLSLATAFTDSVSNITTALQSATPLSGDTVVMVADSRDRLLWLTPAGTIAAATITLPANATSRIGQVAMFGSSQQITALTVDGATTIYNPPSDLQTGDLYKLVKVASDTWARLL